jgi:hypothetical protein
LLEQTEGLPSEQLTPELVEEELELDERELLGALELGATLDVVVSQTPLSAQCCH